MKQHYYIFWNSKDNNMEIKKKLMHWRLGRVAYHQNCLNCHQETLSRKHAVICSGIDQILMEKYQCDNIPHSQTIIDFLLDKYAFGDHINVWKDLSWAISQIEMLCLRLF